MKCRPDSAYLAIFLTSAASATDQAASAARIRLSLLLSYHSRLRMIPRSARAARGRRSG